MKELTDERKQRIASQMNLAKTAFIKTTTPEETFDRGIQK